MENGITTFYQSNVYLFSNIYLRKGLRRNIVIIPLLLEIRNTVKMEISVQ